MRFAIVGLGSMGKRRIRCLQALGHKDLIAVDLRADRRAETETRYGVQTTDKFDSALASSDAVLVCVPGYLHMRCCLAAVEAKRHWFCEVPLSTDTHGLSDLQKRTAGAKLVGAPGCQLLFHPMASALHDWSHAGPENRVLHVSFSCGMYLPEWHSYEDYRSFYASDKSKGGGNLDVIAQELIWLMWVLGQGIASVTARTGKTGTLELGPGTPDHQELIVEMTDGVVMSMHFDLNDRTHERWVRFAAPSGTAVWSTLKPFVNFYSAADKSWREEREPAKFDYEECYRKEVARFVECIEKRAEWPIPIDTAEQVVRLLLAIDKSREQGRTIAISEI